MKYKKSVSVFLAVLALIPAMMTAGCSEESHIITQHTSRPDGTATSKPYATNYSLTKDDITLTVWESKDGPDEFIRKAGDSFHKLYPNITIEYVNVEMMGLIGMGNNPMVGATVAVAVSVEEAAKAGKF